MFIGIDIGRHGTKVVTGDQVIMFESRVGEARELRLTEGGDYRVFIAGQRYFVGPLAEESYSRREMATESKVTEETRILFLTGLALAHPTPGAVVATGLPVYQHTPEGKAALQHLLGGRHDVTVNGAVSRVEVGELLILPEGAAAFWAQVLNDTGMIWRHDLLRLRVRVVDLGSRTVNFVTLIEGRYLDRESGTLNYGCLELEHVAEKHFARKVIGDLARRLPDLKPTDPVLLAGGGALRLAQSFREEFPGIEVLPDPVTANAQGYRKLGMAYERRKNHQDRLVQR